MATDKPKAILLAAKEVIDCLQVEFPSVKLLPWKTEEVTPFSNCKGSLPTDPKLAETFLFGFSRFFAKQNGIFRLLLQHDSSIAKEDFAEFGRAKLISPEYSFSIPHNLTLSNP